MKITISIIYFIFILSTVTNAQTYKITATISGFPDQTKFYLKDNSTDLIIDSAIILNNRFEMTGKSSSVKNLWLYANHAGEFYYCNLLIGGDKITIKGDRKEFRRDLEIKGSTSQDDWNKLNDQTKLLWKTRDSVVSILMPLTMGELQNDSIAKIRKPLSKKLKQIDSSIKIITTKFITENLNSYVAVQELYYNRTEYSRKDFQLIFSGVREPFRNGNYGIRIQNYLKVGNPLRVGDEFYDFQASDLEEKKHQISAYKGKYILLDFTETYCGPCIIAAENLKKIAERYPDQLQVITFYAETNKKIMQEGLDRDKFTWPTIWDGKGTYSEIALKYGIEAYPTFVLIDPNGKIAAKVVGFGKDENGKGNIEDEIDKFLNGSK